MQYSVIKGGAVARKIQIVPGRATPFRHADGRGTGNLGPLSAAELKALGILPDVVVGEVFDPRIEDRSDPLEVVTADLVAVTHTVTDKPLAGVKTRFIRQLKRTARTPLREEADWAVARKEFTGQPIPPAIRDYHAAVRAVVTQAETDIGVATTVQQAAAFFDAVTWPEAP